MEADIIESEQLEMLLFDISRIYGYDFSQYSKASLRRRISRICMLDRLTSLKELRERISRDPAYFQRFIEEVTVSVTSMFRDPLFYQNLRENVIPRIAHHPLLRVWVAGCSTGEEAYSIAILLNEAGIYHKSLVYATDINHSALEKASRGVFLTTQINEYSRNYSLSGGSADFSDYYVKSNNVAKLEPGIIRRIIFSAHNLVSGSSFNEFQLIVCRNVLIYFNKELQNRVFRLFDESLGSNGYLALGSKETFRFSGIEDRYRQLDDEKIWEKIR